MIRIVFIAALAVLCAPSAAQTTQPVSTAELEFRANQAFNAQDYTAALPLLKKAAVAYKDKPDRAAPLLEKIRVSESQLKARGVALPGDVATSAGRRKPHAK